MKQLQLDLNKRLLIVEYETEAECAVEWALMHAFKNPNIVKHGHKVNPICGGSELTEDIAEDISDYTNLFNKKCFADYKCDRYSLSTSAMQSFISAIEAAGYHWGENPVKEPRMSDYGWYASGHAEEDSGWMYEEGEDKYYESLKLFEESESRTFNPEKCIIFEIL
ncbi:hypothetical protein [uncultured Chryseobacterium sp.]|uniref:hypothetical protein n=1 Tax=uncultured Chryseobacterium sp. TaxID=259322 RepID=UPI002590910F|nr:hypothetical protein [uncultured Chryseobacterium sp.]